MSLSLQSTGSGISLGPLILLKGLLEEGVLQGLSVHHDNISEQQMKRVLCCRLCAARLEQRWAGN